jgi:hypothetical protein
MLRGKKLGREYLMRILSLCLSVSKKGVDPFEVEVKKILDSISRYLSEWELPEDFKLDMETLSQLASIVELQARWIKNLSSSLYVDPLLIELKIKMLSAEKLKDVFAKCWHPIVEMQQLVPKRLKEGIDYWNLLPPTEDRWPKLETHRAFVDQITLEELKKQGLLAKASFEDSIKETWEKLKSKGDKVSFWEFIHSDSYGEAAKRAYLTSFLITYGYATLKIDYLKEKVYLIPFNEQQRKTDGKQGISIPLSITKTELQKVREA